MNGIRWEPLLLACPTSRQRLRLLADGAITAFEASEFARGNMIWPSAAAAAAAVAECL